METDKLVRIARTSKVEETDTTFSFSDLLAYLEYLQCCVAEYIFILH